MVTLRCTSARFSTVAFSVLVLLAACGGSSNPGAVVGGTTPGVTATSPADVAVGVPTNAKVFASFSEPMDAGSLGSAVSVKQGTSSVAGIVAVTADGLSLTFAPSAALPASAVLTATIAAAARAATGHPMAADYTWSFTIGTTADTAAPVVSATNPSANATGIPINAKVSATLNKAMDPATVTAANFTVKQGTAAVAGTVSYGTVGTNAVFTPASSLAANTSFTATLGTGAKDLQGNALAAAYSWTFTTGAVAAKGPAPVGLGTAGNYVVLAKTAISTVPSSAVTGNIGVSPAAASYITGFSLVADSTNVFATSPQVSGQVFAANYAVPTPSNLTTAVGNMQAAYNDAAGRPTPDFLELGTGNIGGKTLAPGLYKWTSTVTIPADVVLSGGANDVWIFQTTGDITMDAGKHVLLSGGAQAKNIFWQVAGKATFGANSHFEGVVLAKTDITLVTGATMNGRTLSQTQVVLQQATLTQP